MAFPLSDHCNGETFFNPGPRVEGRLRDLLRWRVTRRPKAWPAWIDLAPRGPLPVPSAGAVTATWINHSTFLLQTPQGNFLTDPVFSDRTSPISWLGPKRVHAPGVPFEALPPIAGVLLSHDHYDHCDLPTLRRLAVVHRPRIFAPLGHAALLASAGIAGTVEIDWWETVQAPTGAALTLLPARHWCRRRPGATNRRLWGGFLLRAGGTNIYFAGDTGYDPVLFLEIGRRMGAPDLALIPIGAFAPRWFMRPAHVNPAEAVQIHRDVGSRQSFAMHWGCWPLSDEGRMDPPEELAAARAIAGLSEEEFRTVTPGESVTLGSGT